MADRGKKRRAAELRRLMDSAMKEPGIAELMQLHEFSIQVEGFLGEWRRMNRATTIASSAAHSISVKGA